MPLKESTGIWWDVVAVLGVWAIVGWLTFRSLWHRGCIWRVVQCAMIVLVLVVGYGVLIVAMQYRTVRFGSDF